jgi:hypothetical protein
MALFFLRSLSPDDSRPRIVCLRLAACVCLATIEHRLKTDDAFRAATHELLHAQKLSTLGMP